MKPLSFYEQCGILLPGSVFLFGLVQLVPAIGPSLSLSGVTVGGLGLFLIIAYAAGHAVAAVGNLLEFVYWKPFGGMPSDWFRMHSDRLLSDDRAKALRAHIQNRLGAEIAEGSSVTHRHWRALFGQLYRDVLTHNSGRIETFNGNYGLCRGLAAALLSLMPFVVMNSPEQQRAALLAWLALGTVVFLFRMHRFGVHFAREVFYNFLNLPASHRSVQSASKRDSVSE